MKILVNGLKTIENKNIKNYSELLLTLNKQVKILYFHGITKEILIKYNNSDVLLQVL